MTAKRSTYSLPPIDPDRPTNRLEAHASQPFPMPETTMADLTAYWRNHYTAELAGLRAVELVDALTATRRALRRATTVERVCRLNGRVDALRAELARRRLDERGREVTA